MSTSETYHSSQQLDLLTELREFGNALYQCEVDSDVIDNALEFVVSRLNAQVASIFTFSKDGDIRRRGIKGVDKFGKLITGDWFPEESYRPGEGFSGKAAAQPDPDGDSRRAYGQPVWSLQLDHEELVYGSEYADRLGFLKTGISVPLNGVHRTFGTMEVLNRLDPTTKKPSQMEVYSPGDVHWLMNVGAFVANALSRLRRKNESKIIHEISYKLANPQSREAVQTYVAEQLVSEYLPYKACIMREISADGKKLMFLSGETTSDISLDGRTDEPRSLDQGIVGEVFTTNRLVEVRDIRERINEYRNKKWIERNNLRSHICLPLSIQGETFGTLSLFTGYVYDFNEGDRSFLENISLLLSTTYLVRPVEVKDKQDLVRFVKSSDLIPVQRESHDVADLELSETRQEQEYDEDVNLKKLEELRKDRDWLRQHRMDYVAIAAGQLVAVDRDVKEVINKAREQFPSEKRLVTQVYATQEPVQILTPFFPDRSIQRLH